MASLWILFLYLHSLDYFLMWCFLVWSCTIYLLLHIPCALEALLFKSLHIYCHKVLVFSPECMRVSGFMYRKPFSYLCRVGCFNSKREFNFLAALFTEDTILQCVFLHMPVHEWSTLFLLFLIYSKYRCHLIQTGGRLLICSSSHA